MSSNETTPESPGQGLTTLDVPLPRVPGMLVTQINADMPALVSESPAAAIVATAPTLNSASGPLRFPQKVSDIRASVVGSPPAKSGTARTCILPKGLTFTGEAHYPCDVRIDGVVDGKVTAEPDRTITVEREGKFKGSLTATNVCIEGSADGDITAKGGLACFGPSSVCKGKITYNRVKIDEGADVEASMKKLAA